MVIPTCFMLFCTHGVDNVSPRGHRMAAVAQNTMSLTKRVQKQEESAAKELILLSLSL